MARSVRDCALFLDAMAGFDPAVPISFPAPDTPFQQAVIEAEGRLKIAFTTDANGLFQCDKDVENHLCNVMAQMERNGSIVEQFCPDLAGLEQTYHTLRGLMWATDARRTPPEIRRYYKKTLEQNIRFGERLRIEDVVEAELNRSTLFSRMLGLFERFDVLACPVTGCMPHPQSTEWVDRIGGQQLSGYMDWLRFAFLATVTGLPAISVPVGLGPRRLPVGLQLIGKPRGEADLLAAARLFELAVGGPLGPIDPVSPAPV